MAKKIVYFLIAMVVMGGAYFGYQKRQAAQTDVLKAAPQSSGGSAAPSSAPQTPAVVEFASTDLVIASTAALARSIPITGSLRPVNQSLVKAKVAGDLRELAVREGMSVTAGQVIASVDGTEYVARLAEREAQLRSTQAQLEQAKRNLSTNKALLEKNFISQSAFDATQSALDVAVANRDAAIAQVAQSRKILADTRLVAPISGVVAERFAQVGEKVSPDNRIISIVDLSKMEIEASVPSSDIGSVTTGQPVTLQVEGIEGTTAGSIVRISPATQTGSRSILVYVAIDNSGAKRNPKLRSGLFAQGNLSLDARPNVLVIPSAAVRDAGGRNFVYVVVDGKLVSRDVQLGIRDESQQASNGSIGVVEVVSGLKSGEQLVGVNLGPLPVGALIKKKY